MESHYADYPRHIFVPVSNQDLEFQLHMSWPFVLSELWRELIVCFVDIGGIDDHHCLSFPSTLKWV
jgi:hypothetical protein